MRKKRAGAREVVEVATGRRVVLALLLILAALSMSIYAPQARSGRLTHTGCLPRAYVPYIYSHTTAGAGDVWNCKPGDPSWYYTIRLAGADGTNLRQSSGGPRTGNTSEPLTTSPFYCPGWSLHSFLYINVGGEGKSYTSGNTTCY